MAASFAETLKTRQIEWARARGLEDALEPRQAAPSWVLKSEHKSNLYDPQWWSLIEGEAHRWARALNSSQCFAVNLFGPLTEDGELRESVWPKLLVTSRLAV